MQPGNKQENHAQGGGSPSYGRSAPEGMPREVASQSRAPRQIERKQDILPEQKPITDDEEQRKPPSKLKMILKRVGTLLLVGLALSLAYIFLLLGEPDKVDGAAPPVSEEAIRVPVQAVEAQGNSDISIIAATFEKPVLMLRGNPIPLQSVRLSDTAFQGGYARRVTFVYIFDDGQPLTVESIRPTDAASLLHSSNASLGISSIYSLAGLDAARMDSSESIVIFGKGEEAVYAVTCPASRAEELLGLLKQTTLLQPGTDNPS